LVVEVCTSLSEWTRHEQNSALTNAQANKLTVARELHRSTSFYLTLQSMLFSLVLVSKARKRLYFVYLRAKSTKTFSKTLKNVRVLHSWTCAWQFSQVTITLKAS